MDFKDAFCGGIFSVVYGQNLLQPSTDLVLSRHTPIFPSLVGIGWRTDPYVCIHVWTHTQRHTQGGLLQCYAIYIHECIFKFKIIQNSVHSCWNIAHSRRLRSFLSPLNGVIKTWKLTPIPWAFTSLVASTGLAGR